MLNNLNACMHKQADAYSDAIAGYATDAAIRAPGVAHTLVTGDPTGASISTVAGIANVGTNLTGGLIGTFDSASDDNAVEALRELENSKAKALIPGVSSYRLARRSRLVGKALARRKNKFLHERLSLINPLNILAAGPAMIAAAATPTRTLEEQRRVEEESPWIDYLIPGVGTYHHFKRLGVSNKLSESKKGDDIDKELKRIQAKDKAKDKK